MHLSTIGVSADSSFRIIQQRATYYSEHFIAAGGTLQYTIAITLPQLTLIVLGTPFRLLPAWADAQCPCH